jgi:hypothetical protein
MAQFPSVPLAIDPSPSDPLDSYYPVSTDLPILDA